MITRIKCILICALLSLGTMRAMAWNNVGHMTVAYVAWQNLDQATKTKITTLIQQTPAYTSWAAIIPDSITGDRREMYLFMIAATWPDQIKSQQAQFPCHPSGNKDTVPVNEDVSLNVGFIDPCIHMYWHFVDESYGTPSQAVPSPNALQKIDFLSAALTSGESVELKAYDLLWLEHLVGDIHQPLHCVTRYSSSHPTGDQGGNKIVITVDPKELHGYWDDILGRTTGNLYTDATRAEHSAQQLPAPDPSAAADNHTSDWVAESLSAAINIAYAAPVGPEWGPYQLSPGYHDAALKMAQGRVALAGTRLANLLTTALQ